MNKSQVDRRTSAILATLGGLKPVLTHYLTTCTQPHTEAALLSATQIQDLHETLSTDLSHATSSVPIFVDENSHNDNDDAGVDEHKQRTGTIQASQAPPAKLERQITLNVKRQQKKFVVYLNEQNDLWHRMLPASKQELADKIVDFLLHSKWTALYLVITFLLAIVCRFWIPVLQSLPSLMNIAWMLANLCSFNVSMSKRMLKSFIFWYKLYSWLVGIIAYGVLFRSSWFIEGLNWVSGTLIIAAVSLHDGWRLNRKFKIAIGFMVWFLLAGIYAFVYFQGNLLFVGTGEYSFNDRHTEVMGQSISVKHICLNAMLNLLIFMARQLWQTIRYKDEASVLSSRPRIIWVADWNQMQSELAQQVLANRTVVSFDDDDDDAL